MVLVIFLYMVIASTFTIGKLALEYLHPMFLIGLRMTTAGSLLLGYLYFFKRSALKFKKEHLFDFIVIILFHIFFAFVAEFWALQYLTSSKICLFYNLSPFITAIFSYFWFSEKMTIKKVFGLLIGFFAFLPVLIAGESSDFFSSRFLFFSWPELAMLFSVVSACFGWIIVRKLGRDGYSMLTINGVGMLGGGLLSFLMSFFFEGTPTLKAISGSFATNVGMALLYTMLLILLANVLFYNLYGYLLKHYTATFLSFAGFLTPFFAAVFGWMFLGESVNTSFFVTIFLVLIGLYLFYQEELRQGYIVSE